MRPPPRHDTDADASRRGAAQAATGKPGKQTLIDADPTRGPGGASAGAGVGAEAALFAGGSSAELPYRGEMEAAFGEDFSDVAVKTDRGDALAAIGAHAATNAERIAFGSASPDRDTVAHELAHVVQHRRHGGGSGGISRRGDASEREAEQVAAAVSAGDPVPAVQHPAVTGDAGAATPAIAETAPAAAMEAAMEGAPEGELEGDGGGAPQATTTAALGGPPGSPAMAPESAPAPAGAPAPEGAPAPASAPAPAGAPASGREAGRSSAEPGSPSAAPAPGASNAWLGIAFGAGAAAAATARATAATPDPGAPLQAIRSVKLSELDQAMRQVTTRIATAAPPTDGAMPAPATPAAPPAAVTAEAPAPPAAAPPAPAATAPAPSRSAPPARPPQPIAHAPAAPPAAAAISAGPRPRLHPTGPADPTQAAVAEASGRQQLDARLAGTMAASAGDLGVAALDAPLAPTAGPAPAPLPSLTLRPAAAPPVPEAPWRKLPADARARLDEAVAPGLEQRLTALTARSEADAAQTQAQLAQAQAGHEAQRAASHQRAQAEAEAQRTTGAAQVDAVRDRWRAQGHAVRDQAVAQVQAQQAAAEQQIQGEVQTGEADSDAILTGAERDAGATRGGADARAREILAAAAARAADARARPGTATLAIARQDADADADGGDAAAQGDGEAEARQILEDAQAEVDREIARAEQEIERLIENAGNQSEEVLERRLLLIVQRINALRASLVQQLDEALGDRFPALEAAYAGQIELLLGDIRRNLLSVADAVLAGDAELAAAQLETARALIDARTERLNATLEDAAVLSTFEDLDSALDAFDITMTSDETLGDGQRAWNDNDRQAVLGQAIRMENAFRDADEDGLFAAAGLTEPGAAFSAIMNGGNGITLHMANNVVPYTDAQRQQMFDADPARYDNDPTKVPASYTRGGAFTNGAGQITYYSLSRDQTDGLANARAFHFGHEFGHAFNSTMIGATNALDDYDRSDVPYTNNGEGQFDLETISADGIPIAGNGVDRFVPTSEVIAQLQEDFPETWQAELQSLAAAQGMQSGTMTLGSTDERLRMFPYQQNATDSSGEWFADLYVNWANGTLADGPAGEALDEWMDDHMQEWIRMRLLANEALAS